MTRLRLALCLLLVQSTGLAVAIVILRPPLVMLARHGALPWSMALVGLTLAPLALVASYRWPSVWSAVVAGWTWTLVGVAGRLHRWMTPSWWALITSVVLVAALAVWLRWQVVLRSQADPTMSARARAAAS